MSTNKGADTKELKGYNTLAPNNGTFSGADVAAYIIFPGRPALKLGQVTTLTYSTYRETTPVRTLGRINAKGFSKGQRTIAGTIIFTVFDKHVVNQIKENVDYIAGIKKLKPCELPPFDIMLSFGNEYGASAKLFIYGIEVVDEGKIFSVEDMFTENTWSYMARDIDLMDDVNAPTYPPNVSLGETTGSGTFAVEDLVGGSDYKKMLEDLERMKNEKEAAIDAAREASKEYITSNDVYESEQVVIVKPEIPGGDKEWDIPDYADPDEMIEQCYDIKMRNCDSVKESQKVNTDKGERLFRVDFDINWWKDKHTMQHILAGKTVRVRFECMHPDKNGKLVPIAKEETFKILDKSFTAVRSSRARLYIIISGYTQHTVKPVVKIKPLFEKFSYTYETDGFLGMGKKKVTVNFKMANTNFVEVKGDGEATEKYPLVFKGAEENSKDDQQNEVAKQTTCKITIKTIVPKLRNIPGRGYASNQQPVFLLGGDLGITGIGRNAIKDTNHGSSGTQDNGWIHASTPNLAFSIPYEDQIGVDKTLLWTGFGINVEIFGPDGKKLTSKSDLGKYKLVCDYRMIATIKKSTQSVSSEYTVTGEQERQRYSWYRENKKISEWLEKPREWTMKYYSNTNMYFNDVELRLIESISDVYRSVHNNTDPNKDVKYWMDDPYEMLKPSICDCRFKFDDMIFEVYNFKVVNKSGVELPATRDICGSSKADAACRFRITTLDSKMREAIKKL